MPVKDTKEPLKLYFVFKILSTSAVCDFLFEVRPKRLFLSSSALCIEQQQKFLYFALLIQMLVFVCMHTCICFSRYLLCLVFHLLLIPFCLLLQLADFRDMVSRMLGLNVASLALPDYEIITRLEELIHSHQHHYFPCVCLKDVARAPEEHSQRNIQLLH